MRNKLSAILCAAIFTLSLGLYQNAQAKVKGIYISQTTLEDTKKINYLIKQAKATGINTFVIDYNHTSKAYLKNIELVQNSNIKYIARIVVFPGGGSPSQVSSTAYRDKKLTLIKQAVALGASEIQLDYIRYHTRVKPSPQNEKTIASLMQWYRTQVNAMKIPLQVDIFGITSFRPEKRIGQNAQLIAGSVDAMCPMVYPSHFEPYRHYSQRPYDTVLSSVKALREKAGDHKVKIYPYIEAYNYRYPMSNTQKLNYIRSEIKAAEDSNADGWLVWSASNYYDHLFSVLRTQEKSKIVSNEKDVAS